MPIPLTGLRVLVVEDEALLSMLIEDALSDVGCVVIGPFMRLQLAVEAATAESHIDLAILDVDIAGERSFPLADLLLGRGVPVIFTTGYDDAGLEERWRVLPVLRKPFSDEDLKRTVRQVASARQGPGRNLDS